MRKLVLLILLSVFGSFLYGQSKSIDKFRKKFPESTNLFFYSSTIQMLNQLNDPELTDLIKDIEKIRVLNYTDNEKKYKQPDLDELRENLKKEKYLDLLILYEQGNRINLYAKEKNGKTIGFVALVDSSDTLVILDVKGSIDFGKFMTLKNNLDLKL
ncbi:MAG: DUF4252 domain-containing protein [Bacteroidales bacterium]|nr:DUF4252 domain-containing protein [Bacteroidales bacterium]